MRTRVARTDRLVMPGSDQFAIGADQQGTDRYLVKFGRPLRLIQRLPHPVMIYSHSMVPGGLPEIS